MVMVKCKACGKRYDYKQHGCCPSCGAYNRPPQRNRVGADGVVYHMNDKDFLNNSAQRRRSQGSKVCFEQDVCYEEQAKKVRDGSKPWEEPIKARGARQQKQAKAQQKKGKKKPVGIAIALVAVVSILPTILTSCLNMVADVLDQSFPDEIFTGTEDISYTYASYEAQIGEKFLWNDEETVVTEVSIDPEAEYQVTALIEGEDLWDFPMLYYRQSDGTVEIQGLDMEEEVVTGKTHRYYYRAPNIEEASECYLEFCGFNGETYCTTIVYLTQ